MQNQVNRKASTESETTNAPRPRADLGARRIFTPRRIDLHTHTYASDGEHSPEELVSLARERGLDTLALTDHDTVAGLARALRATEQAGDIQLIPGVELSTDVPGFEIHVLGYFVDWQNPEFLAMLGQFREGRIGRAEKIVGLLDELGAPVSFARVQEIAGDGAIGRPHIARALLEAGHVSTVKEAFDRYLANDKPAYVPHWSLTPVDAVAFLKRTGAVPVMAHPRGITQFIPDLLPAGLQGLECYYAEYDEREQRELLDTARKYGLIATGGSDFHGLHKMGHMSALGEVRVPPEVVEKLLQAKEKLNQN